MPIETLSSRSNLIIAGVLVVLLIVLGFLTLSQKQKIVMLLEERNFFLLETASTTATLGEATSTIAQLEEKLASAQIEIESLEADLKREENRNEEFEDQIDKLTGTVGDLTTLANTDEELLQKYSNVYFLNENYIPSNLKKIATKYVLPGRAEQYFQGDARPFLEEMLDEAAADGIDLKVTSAYRSFDHQADLKGAYTQSYGSGANAFSADQGYSEHQLGTTVDLSDTATGGPYGSFAGTAAYKWLQDNAYKYGFILSYPEGNSYYVYEPWHWRFVGTDLARDLKRDGKSFYDLDQREIDKYLLNIFD